MRNEEDIGLLTRFQCVYFIPINCCVYEFRSSDGIYFMTREQYLLVHSDIGERISLCRQYQIDLEILLDIVALRTKQSTTVP